MADSKLSALSPTSNVNADDLLYIVQDGLSQKIVSANLASHLLQHIGAAGEPNISDLLPLTQSDTTRSISVDSVLDMLGNKGPIQALDDSDHLFMRVGGAIKQILISDARIGLGLDPILVPPLASDYTWVNQGSAQLTDTAPGMVLYAPDNGNVDSLRIAVKAVPESNYDLRVRFDSVQFRKNYNQAGICLRQSSDGKIVMFCHAHDATGATLLIVRYSNATTVGASTFAITNAQRFPWMRIVDDTIDRIFYVSMDGVNWLLVFSESRTTYMTADQFGVVVNPYNAAAPAAGANVGVMMTIRSWTEQ